MSANMSSRSDNCTSCTETQTPIWQCNTGGDILHIIFCLLVMVLGIPGNALILRVYWSKPRKTSTTILIIALAWADLFSCVLLVHAIITSCIFGIGETPLPLAILRYFLISAAGISVNTTSMIAFDRYDCVCRANRRLLSPKRVVVVIAVGFTYTTSANWMYLALQANPGLHIIPLIMLLIQVISYLVAAVLIVICYGKVHRTIRNHVRVGIGMTTGHCGQDRQGDSGQTKTTSLNYNSSENSPVSIAASASTKPETRPSGDRLVGSSEPAPSSNPHRGPLGHNVDNLASNIQLPIIPNSSTNTKPPDPSAPPTALQRKTTRMLLITSIVFLLSWVPYWIYVASLLATFQGASLTPLGVFVVEKSAYLLYLNNAVNPLIYGLANRRFRKECKEALHKYKICK